MTSVLTNAPLPEAGFPASSGDSIFIDRYGFQLLGHQILLPESTRAELIELPTISPIANTPNHYLGVCNLRGNLIPCYQLTENKHRYLLIIGDQEPAALAIDHMAKRFSINEENRAPCSDIHNLLFSSCGIAFYDSGRQITIDPEKFFLYLSDYRGGDLLKGLHA